MARLELFHLDLEEDNGPSLHEVLPGRCRVCERWQVSGAMVGTNYVAYGLSRELSEVSTDKANRALLLISEYGHVGFTDDQMFNSADSNVRFKIFPRELDRLDEVWDQPTDEVTIKELKGVALQGIPPRSCEECARLRTVLTGREWVEVAEESVKMLIIFPRADRVPNTLPL